MKNILKIWMGATAIIILAAALSGHIKPQPVAQASHGTNACAALAAMAGDSPSNVYWECGNGSAVQAKAKPQHRKHVRPAPVVLMSISGPEVVEATDPAKGAFRP